MSDIAIFDIEGDGLNPTKIHCLSVYDGKYRHTTDYNKMRKFFTDTRILVGHNIIRWDIPVIERILKIKVNAILVDTLSLSWYLYPDRVKHGLEWWGEDFNIPKPPIDDWHNLTTKEYIHRCNEDVKINKRLWDKMYSYLQRIYDNEEKLWEFLKYLSFKMDCAREQERSRWKLDVEFVKKGLSELEAEQSSKTNDLRDAMPKVPVLQKRTRPAKPYKKDGSYSSHGEKWFALLDEHNLPHEFDGELSIIKEWKEPNPGSHQQVKDWLYSLGWKPETFKFVRDKETGDVRKIPQINLEHGGGICPSIHKLIPTNPELILLEGLGVISHRIGLLNGFLNSVDNDGFVRAEIQGLTNTLRFKHAVCVNLPGVFKPYGELIRGSLMARKGYELCGSDMSGLEDRLKQHYIYPYDPDYVNEMLSDDYDPHLSLALIAGAVNENQVAKYKSGEDTSIKTIRHTFKQGNYACQYGAGPPRLALTADITEAEAKKIHTAYWKKNWAIKQVAKDQKVKNIDGQMWLLNPINGFYYSLRYEKDIFSTLVQGSASYVFDLWVKNIRSKRPQLTAQFHDEIILEIKKGFREKCNNLINWAIEITNKQLNLNRRLDVDIQYGERYSAIH